MMETSIDMIAAALAATLALIPCRPASLDLLAIDATVDVIKLASENC